MAAAAMLTAVVITVSPTAEAEEEAVWSSEKGAGNSGTVSTTAEVRPQRRKPLYFSAMVTGSVLHEDGENRLTQDGDTTLFTPGLVLRLGGVIDEHHLVGAGLRASWVNTRSILDEDEQDNHLGAVSTYMLGSEYRYLTSYGFYFGGSASFAVVLADDKLGGGDDEAPACDTGNCLDEHLEQTDDHASFGVALLGTIGYEHRFRNNFTISVEAYAGFIRGKDEHAEDMTNGTYGVAFGIGI
jgi:hypothetical protein